MVYIAPTVTATDRTLYRKQLEEIQSFSQRIHLDIMDGVLAPIKSLDPEFLWWQPGPRVDIHVMYKKPVEILEKLIKLQPSLIIFHASADELEKCLREVKSMSIDCGVALLPEEMPSDLSSVIELLDHVLIFSGHLGHFGGEVDFGLADKIKHLKNMKPSLEIGWDGGVNDANAKKLCDLGVDVLNVGGYIHRAKDPESAYDKLIDAVGENL